MSTFPSSSFSAEIEKPEDSTIDQAVNYFLNSGDPYIFYGLASYYNNTNYFLVDVTSITPINKNMSLTLKEGQWIALTNRHDVLAIKASGLAVKLMDGKLVIDDKGVSSVPVLELSSKDQLFRVAPELDQLRYNHLWAPLAHLSRTTEAALVLIQKNIVGSWGWAVVVFAISLKLLLLPIGIITVKFQRTVSQTQSKLAPLLSEIKATSDGEQAHNRIIAAHKELGVSPFYTLKPLLGSFIQIPILIAVFNALGEMPQFNQQQFFWIESLAHPDIVGQMPITLQIFGNKISVLPFLMTAITLYSTIIFKNQ